MRFLDMWSPLTFVGYDIASKEHVDETLRELFGVKPHLAVTLGIAIASLSAGLSGFVGTAIVTTSIACAGFFFRIVIEQYFKARKTVTPRRKLIRLLFVGSMVSVLTSGLSTSLLFYAAPPPTQMLVMGVVCAMVQGAAGRAYMMPGTALLNISGVLGMLVIAAIARGNYLIPPFGLIYFAFLANFVGKMVANRLRQLEAEQTARHLFQEIVEKNELLRVTNEALAAKAHEDPLTGLANRRKFDIALPSILETAQKEASTVSLLMIDVDHFKSFNDTYGHQAGDECLRIISRVIDRTIALRNGLVARYGGEEFVAILPRTNEAQAQAIAERIRTEVSLTNLHDVPNAPPPQTISIGIASTPGTPSTREAMLQAADQALYKAKKLGRNRVSLHKDEHRYKPRMSA